MKKNRPSIPDWCVLSGLLLSSILLAEPRAQSELLEEDAALLSDIVPSPISPMSTQGKDTGCCSTSGATGGQITLGSFEISEISRPAVGMPVTYLLEGGSTDQIPNGSTFTLELPADTDFLEVAAINPAWGDLEQLPCVISGTTVECSLPDQETLLFPVAFTLMHKVESVASVAVSITPPSDVTVDGPSSFQVNTEVVQEDWRHSVVDVLFIHDSTITADFPESKLRTQFDAWVAYANDVLRESGIKILLRNVGIEEFAVDPELSIFQVKSLIADSDFYSQQRLEKGADVGVYFKKRTQLETCGVASLGLPGELRWLTRNDQSLAVVQEQLNGCGGPASTFLHEVGHLMGLGHNVEVPRGFLPTGYWSFARGHSEILGQDPNGNDYTQGTLMAANSTNRFANPDIICPAGLPCGRDIDEAEPADAALALNALRFAIADAMPSQIPQDSSDIGIFLRGLESPDSRMGVRAEIQNYSESTQEIVQFEIESPNGWILSETSPTDACNAVPTGYACNLSGLGPFAHGSIDLLFNAGDAFQPSFSGTLLSSDAYSGNNTSIYDPRYNLRIQEQKFGFMDDGDPNTSTNGIYFLFLSGHMSSNIDLKIDLEAPEGATVRAAVLERDTGFDFDLGASEREISQCQFSQAVSGSTIDCPIAEVIPIIDQNYAIPPFDNRIQVQVDLSFADGSVIENPEVSVQTFAPSDIEVPDPPADISAMPGDAEATISFSPPADDGGSPITGYTVVSTPGGVSASGESSPIVVPDLTNGISYTFTATATNNAGESDASATSNSVTPRPEFTVGGVVSGLELPGLALDLNNSSLLLFEQDGTYSFSTGLPDGAGYSVTAPLVPNDHDCTILNATGSVAGDNVEDVDVLCSTDIEFADDFESLSETPVRVN